MPKITFIGAGSMVFAKTLVGDLLSFPELSDSTVSLMDIDENRLERTRKIAEAMVENEGLDATIETTTDRREAIRDADYVLNMINVGGAEPFENEIRIPEKYGVKQAIGDTLGPGGIFRGLRTVPTLLDIAADMEELCPDALLLNFTNPMAILCWAIQEATDIEIIGLCHSVPQTASTLANYVDVPADEVDYWVAGINHMAWFLQLEHESRDLYPELREVMTDREIYEQDTVRFELFRHFDAFVTESSAHVSEYVPYMRTESERIAELSGREAAERVPTASYLDGWKEDTAERDEPLTEAELAEAVPERSDEYAARVIHSLETDTVRRMNLNVSNTNGLITNLPTEACVEVPCLVDGTGVRPCTVGDLPPQLAALCRTNIAVQERTVRGALDGDRTAVKQAVKLDPLSAASCTLPELDEMAEELITANADYLPDLT